ncbi:hypothetical protein LSTR_LSTR010822 [Laodelphax striatellus]|uniref:Uncharacterized protein n=1 Tax=Laodelphax striatellus TaxID=195883 RepID=A0A482WMA4_LAOST|nr:hypothetical protein LSTR_LSTR010822 [Laodelphax striatellus]
MFSSTQLLSAAVELQIHHQHQTNSQILCIIIALQALTISNHCLKVQAKQLKPLGLECECEGGGRIKHDRDERRLLVYGYSQGFGRAQHQLAVDLLKVTYPDYEVTWTNDGY